MIAAIMIAASLNNIDPALLFAICHHESRGDYRAYSPHDGHSPSYGICQIKYNTAKAMGFGGKPKELMNEETNAYYAGKFLAWQLKRYKGNKDCAVSAYNAGKCSGSNSAYVTAVLKIEMEVK